MKKRIIIYLLPGLMFHLNAQHNFIIQAGTNITTANNAILVLENCNLENASINASFSNCLLTETGSLNTTIGSSAPLDFKELTINKAAATLKMTGQLTIQSKLNFQSGYVDLNNNILYLAPQALFIGEKSSSRLIGDNGGFASINVIMNNPNLQNPGNLGLSVTSAADMGTVSILRGHKIQSNNGDPFSIKRTYSIESSNDSDFSGTMRFTYFDEELGSISEPSLQIWSSINGTSWQNRGYTGKNEILNYIESSALTTLETFTMADPIPGLGSPPKLEFNINSKQEDQSKLQFDAELFPNPVHLHEPAWIALTTNFETNGHIQIINPSGQVLRNIPFTAAKGLQRFALKTTDLQIGIYMVHIMSDNGPERYLKLLIN